MICCVPGSSPEPRHFEKREDPGDEVESTVLFWEFEACADDGVRTGAFRSLVSLACNQPTKLRAFFPE